MIPDSVISGDVVTMTFEAKKAANSKTVTAEYKRTDRLGRSHFEDGDDRFFVDEYGGVFYYTETGRATSMVDGV